MLQIRCLNEKGIALFKECWNTDPPASPPPDLLDNDEYTQEKLPEQIDEARQFKNRYEFGVYLNEVLKAHNFFDLISRRFDGMWSWLCVVFFEQMTRNRKNKYWHFIVERQKTSAGNSVEYRNYAKNSYELVHVHGLNAILCLGSMTMDSWGEFAEQLSASQRIRYHKGFFTAGRALFWDNEREEPKPKCRSRPVKKELRKPGDRTGYGSVRRLATTFNRLDLTYDSEGMEEKSLVGILPKEFKIWLKGHPA